VSAHKQRVFENYLWNRHTNARPGGFRLRSWIKPLIRKAKTATARERRNAPSRPAYFFADHEIGRELKAMSKGLDEHRELIGLAAEDRTRR
jgi:IS5 family transposase